MKTGLENLDNIFNTIEMFDNTYISLRLWVKNKYNNEINTNNNIEHKENKIIDDFIIILLSSHF